MLGSRGSRPAGRGSRTGPGLWAGASAPRQPVGGWRLSLCSSTLRLGRDQGTLLCWSLQPREGMEVASDLRLTTAGPAEWGWPRKALVGGGRSQGSHQGLGVPVEKGSASSLAGSDSRRLWAQRLG